MGEGRNEKKNLSERLGAKLLRIGGASARVHVSAAEHRS